MDTPEKERFVENLQASFIYQSPDLEDRTIPSNRRIMYSSGFVNDTVIDLFIGPGNFL